MALTVQDMCSKWRLNGRTAKGSLQTWPLGHASESTELRASQSHTADFACGDTAEVPSSTRVSGTHGSLLVYTPGTGSVIATPRPPHLAKFAGHDEVESRFSQVAMKRSLTTGVRQVRQDSVVDRSNSHLIA
jgi:hypothetical protein